ncbi:MAG: gephyrin-like molybdotransferase Glp [Pseudomonadota bacterium]
MTGLTPLDVALEQVLSTAQPVSSAETVLLTSALGRTLAEDVHALVDVPPYDNSAMDGYAIRAADASRHIPVSQRIPAGSAGTALEPGTAARIFTGAPIPAGADAVVMQENCELEGEFVRILEAPVVGSNIRPRGQDIEAGTVVLPAGRRVRAEDLGVIASIGVSQLSVKRRLVVAILSTGDELADPGISELGPGQIYNSNRYTLTGLLQSHGFDVLDLGLVADDPATTRDALSQAAEKSDCVITTGGVSVGEEDHVRSQVQSLGSLELWKLKLKPGKPLAFGRIGETVFFGLPGNPAAVYVTFAMLVRPWLLRAQGALDEPALVLSAEADFVHDRAGMRLEFLRGRVSVEDGVSRVRLHPNQSSGVLSSVAWANALVVIEPGQTISRGDPVDILLLDQLNR